MLWRFCRLTSRRKLSSYRAGASTLNDLLLSMPKERKHIPEAQQQRKRIKERLAKYVPGRITLQVLGTGAEGAPRSLYVFSDQSRYLFNIGEGTQRLAHEHKMKLAKLEHVFVTQNTWRNIGGLPGTALTIQDVGVPEIILHGPEGLEELFIAMRRFVVLKDLQVKMAECNERTSFEDNVMHVQYVPLRPDKTNATNLSEMAANAKGEEIVEDDTDYYAHEASGRRTAIETDKVTNWMLKAREHQDIVMNYICKLHPRPGALSLEKCVEYGVPAGPLLGKLKGGEDIVLRNGKIVKSASVREPDDPGITFIVVDCPNEQYLDALLANDEFKKYQSDIDCDNLAHLVVHFTPESIFDCPKYKEWMDRFSFSTQHLILNERNKCLGSLAVHRIQYKLNMLHDTIFPLLKNDGTPMETAQAHEAAVSLGCKRLKTETGNGIHSASESLENLSVKASAAPPPNAARNINTLCYFHLRPRKGFDRSAEIRLAPDQFRDETMAVDGFADALQRLREKVAAQSEQLDVKAYPRLLFLGTGSCIPNKTRNTSGIFLRISEKTNLVMDCGEGTYGQLVRFFGSESDEMLATIKGVYISHLHADHHIGLIGLLLGRRRALKRLNRPNQPPLMLFAPKQIVAFLNFYDTCFESIRDEFKLIPNTDLLLNEETADEDLQTQILNQLEMQRLNTVFVRHCPNAFGASFIHKDGYKITYSGDTMPCENLVALGRNCDVLIHEATMEDELADEAVIKMHSTTSQAIEIGKRMEAKHILLTHFSQRYAKLPRVNENLGNNVGIAFDNMEVKLDELPLLPLFYPALKLMFAEHCEEMEMKANKRQLKLERQRERERSASLL